jgi:hypothetical protein
MSKTAIFANENNESAIQIVRSTMQVSLNDDGEAIVSFATNRGKGSGAQSMSVAHFRDAIETLEFYADNGIEDSATDLSPAETIRQTISVDEGEVTFRTRSGKGAKPAKIPASQFAEVIALLAGTIDAVEGAAESLTGSNDTPEESTPEESPSEDGDDLPIVCAEGLMIDEDSDEDYYDEE